MKKNETDLSETQDKKKQKNENELVMVSFRLEQSVKDAIVEAAHRHGRTISGQFARSLKDGQELQDLIKQVSDHLSEEITLDDKVFTYKPDEKECLDFIKDATQQIINQMNHEKKAAGKK